jgi:type VI secretion system protein ImpJ
MRQLSKVVWYEGMPLAQHHFQAQARYFESSIDFALSALSFAPYGVSRIEMDVAALQGGLISLVRAVGLMPDGLTFDIPEGDPAPAPRALAAVPAARREEHVVLLAIPPHRQNAPNVGAPVADGAAAADAPRFSRARVDVTDDVHERDVRQVDVGRKNFRLLLDVEAEDAGLVLLPIARVRRARGGGFAYDPDYVPPCVQIGASPRLLAVLAAVTDVLEARRQALAGDRSDARLSVAFGAHEITTFWLLHTINASLTPLRHLLMLHDEHPERLYTELARLAGALCTFRFGSDPRSLPLYDHERLGECIGTLERHIRTHLDLVVPTTCIRVPLRATTEHLHLGTVGDRRALGQSRWILGVRSPLGMAVVAERAPRLAKVCSGHWVTKLVERGLSGMTLTHLPSPPPAVTPRADTRYFEIDTAGPCWDHVRKTGTVGVYLPAALEATEVDLAVVVDA